MYTEHGDVGGRRDGRRTERFGRDLAAVAAGMAGIGVEQGQRPVPQVVKSVSYSRRLDGRIVLEPQRLQVVQ